MHIFAHHRDRTCLEGVLDISFPRLSLGRDLRQSLRSAAHPEPTTQEAAVRALAAVSPNVELVSRSHACIDDQNRRQRRALGQDSPHPDVRVLLAGRARQSGYGFARDRAGQDGREGSRWLRLVRHGLQVMMCGLVSEGEDTQASPSEFAHLSRIAQVDHVDASVAITLGATGLARARAVQVELDHLRERGERRDNRRTFDELRQCRLGDGRFRVHLLEKVAVEGLDEGRIRDRLGRVILVVDQSESRDCRYGTAQGSALRFENNREQHSPCGLAPNAREKLLAWQFMPLASSSMRNRKPASHNRQFSFGHASNV
jgi:hypothetical protein